jgi:uncharacterized protein (PEP-CTERM system associated)
MGTMGTGRIADGSHANGRVPLLRSRLRRRGRAIALVGAVSLTATPAHAESWRFLPSIGLEETLTNNVDLEPTSTRRGDLVSQLTPALGISGKSAHASLYGSIALPILLYVKTGAENNRVEPQVNLTGNAELVERFLFIDGSIYVTQQFFSPFGARPDNLGNSTDNRYTSQVYRISPYIKGEASDKINYELRVDNIWNLVNNAPTSFDGVPVNTSNSYTNQVIGKIARDPLPFGWQVDYNRSDVRFTDQSDSQLSELGRLRLQYQPDPVLQVSASAGYEHNDFPFTTFDGAIYGAGYKWRPSAVLSSEGFLEHRYFGSSYGFNLDYRTPLSVWSVNASRGTTSYPQQLATLPAGDVTTLLNALFSSRVVDPAQRQQLVDQVIRDRGLPGTLSGPVTLYTQQVTLQEAATVTFGLLGARNSIFFSGSYLKSEPIAGSGDPLPPALAGANDNTQYGANIAWNHQLTQLVSVGANLSWSRTVPNAPILLPGEVENLGTTNLTALRVFFSAPVSPNTTLYGGVRYQVQTSNLLLNEYNETAAFAGFRYAFR